MKLLSLWLRDFKNLHDLTIDFDDPSSPTLAAQEETELPYTDTTTTVILGRNGTGKSNLLEALILIFRNLDLGQPPAFAYHLTYLWRENEVSIDADPDREHRQVQIRVDGASINFNAFSKDPARRYQPSYVFGYYSGPSNRMESHFDEHQKRFYNALLKGDDQPLRPLLYARLVHSQFALLSFFNEQDPEILEFLREQLDIEGLESVLFVMRKPSWNSKDGDPRFWNARGVVQKFLSRLYELSLVPLRLPRRISVDFKGTTTLEHLYLYLKSADDLKELSRIYDSQQDFFKALESTYISEILSEVRIRVRIHNADGSLTFRDLSEGEQQLLMVLGLLRFTKEEEALFLLDEPDTHLNPAWGIQYLDFIAQVVGAQKSHIIMSTHNPLVISSLDRQQVRIMRRDEQTGHVSADIPDESPRGMGVASILTSDLFGLRSTLDLPTQDLVDERRELAVKEQRTPADEQRLVELNRQLRDLDFSITLPDPLYRDYVHEMTRQQSPDIRHSVTLTDEQRQRQRELTRAIINKIKAEKEHEA